MTSLTSYELHSNILFILLDGIRTQDLVGGALTFSRFLPLHYWSLHSNNFFNQYIPKSLRPWLCLQHGLSRSTINPSLNQPLFMSVGSMSCQIQRNSILEATRSNTLRMTHPFLVCRFLHIVLYCVYIHPILYILVISDYIKEISPGK